MIQPLILDEFALVGLIGRFRVDRAQRQVEYIVARVSVICQDRLCKLPV